MKIIIYGAGRNGKKIVDRMDLYKDVEIVGFVDSNLSGEIYGFPIIEKNELAQKYRDFPVIISVASFISRKEIYNELLGLGIKKIYYYLMKDYSSGTDFFDAECVSLIDRKENLLFYAEMSIIDYCNLNCKGCNHYSPIFPKVIPNIKIRLNDVGKIRSLYDEIIEFGLIGGEPFCNPEIVDYLKGVRSILPKTQIQMVTNGLLIPGLDNSVFKALSENRITIAISPYVPTLKIIDVICNRLKENRIDYVIKPVYSKEMFYKTLSITKNSKYPSKCISDGCLNICDGKIARCPSVLYIDRFNKYFSTNFPNEGILVLDEYSNGKDLDRDLKKRIPLCDFCIEYQFKWEPCGKKIKIDDFAVLE